MRTNSTSLPKNGKIYSEVAQVREIIQRSKPIDISEKDVNDYEAKFFPDLPAKMKPPTSRAIRTAS